MNKPLILFAATVIIATGLFSAMDSAEYLKHPESCTIHYGQYGDEILYRNTHQSRANAVMPQPRPSANDEEEETKEEHPHEDRVRLSWFGRLFASCLGISNNR